MPVTSRSATVTLPTDDQILITREFDAPPELVWRAWTEPELVSRWWTSKRGNMLVCDIDLRVGGTWRWVMTTEEGGFEVGFHGEYRELDAPHRMVSTETFEGMPDAYSVNTMTLTALEGGRARMETLVQHQAAAHRDAHIQSGMEDGMQDAFDLLEQVAVSLED